MRQLYDRTNIIFQSVTYDIQTNTAYYINHVNFPDMNVVQAVLSLLTFLYCFIV